MYVEDANELWACFRCGAQQPDMSEDEATGLPICGECGEHGVVTFQLALDILNDMYLKEVFVPKGAEIYDDNTIDYDYYLDEFSVPDDED